MGLVKLHCINFLLQDIIISLVKTIKNICLKHHLLMNRYNQLRECKNQPFRFL